MNYKCYDNIISVFDLMLIIPLKLIHYNKLSEETHERETFAR